MNILSIDTSGNNYSLSVSKENEITSFQDKSYNVSSESILVEIDNIVSKSSLSPNQINTLIYNNGPGSFTGIRVSSAIVQAIGFSNDCPVYGINSLNLDAYYLYKKYKSQKIQIAKKAFGDQIFHGLFEISDTNCHAKESISTISFTDVKPQPEYMFATNSSNIQADNDKYETIDNYMGSELLIDYYKRYCQKKEGFDYKDALPSYAGHTI
tara:strand:+ start:1382 stop:2014 length:633 start_codon:yes stop_codon:yes gene_type:complete